MKTITHLLFACCLSLPLLAAEPQSEAALIKVLTDGASTHHQKNDACIELGRVGTQAAVAPLAALLADDKLAHMARYALETIPHPSVDEALRAALGRLQGRLLTGVIQSVGVRRDAQAVPALAKHLGATDPEVAAAAAVALGRIGTPAAREPLVGALGRVPAAAEGLLACAEAAVPTDACALYDRLRASQVPSHVKMAAVRGAILSRGAEAGLPLLLEQLRSDDPAMFSVALRVGQELVGTGVTQAFATELPRLPAVKQVGVVALLGERGDGAAAPALIALVERGEPVARVAAIAALERLGCAAALPVFARLAVSKEDEQVVKAAQAALVSFSGQEADAMIVSLLDKPDNALRLLGIDLAGRRRIVSAVPRLLDLAASQDAQLAAASLKVLGELAGEGELNALLTILPKTPVLEAAERAVSAVCQRLSVLRPGAVAVIKAVYGVLPDGPQKEVTAKVAEMIKDGKTMLEINNGSFGDSAPGKVKQFEMTYTINGVPRKAKTGEGATLRIDVGAAALPPPVFKALTDAYAQANGAPKLALLRILSNIGGAESLALVRQAAASADPTLKEAAQRALCDWQSPDVVPDLEALITADKASRIGILALRAYAKLVPAQQIPVEQKRAALTRALEWATRDEERALIQATLKELK
jgi:HEAT repeat protein